MSPTEFAGLFRACPDGRAWAVATCATMDEVWEKARPDWLLWIATQPSVLDVRTLRLFAVWAARQVQHLMTDPRSRAALDVAERYANGQATDGELAAARNAAWAASDAAWDAALDAAWAAAWAASDAAGHAAWDAADAARAAVWAAWDAADAARAAVWAAGAAAGAARDAARAAADAARDAARAAQAAWLRDNAKPDWERAREMGGAR